MKSGPTMRAAALAAGLLLPSAGQAADGVRASAPMMDTDGRPVGEVTLRGTPSGTLIEAKLTRMPPGRHAFHIHGVGRCAPPFDSAGGHFNPTDADHGFLTEGGPHAGDFPNLHIPASGALAFEALNPRVELDDRLFDADGAAIVIHRGGDDYRSQPSGSAGPRIACGVIRR